MRLNLVIWIPRADLEELGHCDFELMAENSCIDVSYHVSAQALHKRELAPLDRN